MVKSKELFIAKKYFKNVKKLFFGIFSNGKNFVFGNTFSKAPVCVVWNITKNCNLTCSFCGCSSVQNSSLKLNLNQQFTILDKLSKQGVWLVSFCGGEPLLLSDLDKLIRHAKQNKLLVNVSTNGLLLKEKAKMIIDSGVDYLTISIDSYKSETLEQLRENKNLLPNILGGIELIRKYSKKHIYIEARCLINAVNMYELEDYIKFWQKKVDNVIFKPIYNNKNQDFIVPNNLYISSFEKERFSQYFSSILDKNSFFDNDYHRAIPEFFFNPEKLKTKYFCFAGTFFASIDELGNLYPCSEFSLFKNESLGNLVYEDFKEVWNNGKSLKIRNALNKGCHCDCWMDRFDLNIWLYKALFTLKKIINLNDKKKKS